MKFSHVNEVLLSSVNVNCETIKKNKEKVFLTAEINVVIKK
jgi:hypothetical protein